MSNNPQDLSLKFLEAIKDSYLYQLVSEPTRARGGENLNLLDLLFTNNKGLIMDIEHRAPLGKSDHCMLVFNLACYPETANQESRPNYNRGHYDTMSTMLDIDWDECLSKHPTVDSKWVELKRT